MAKTYTEAGDNLRRAVKEVVDSFTHPDGGFIDDNLTRVEYESLKAALDRYEAASSPTNESEASDGNG